MFDGTSSDLVINGSQLPTDKTIQRTSGLFQGSVLSPLLFNIFIDKLASTLSPGPPTHLPKIILFCDDVLLHATTRHHLQALLDTCSVWADAHGMTFGIHKCGTTSNIDLKLHGELIPKVTRYPYLGFTHTQSGIDFSSSALERIKKAHNILTSLKLSGTSSLPTWLKLAMYKTFIRPTAEYGLPLACSPESSTNKPVSTAFQHLQSEAVHWILPGNKNMLKVKQSLLGLGVATFRLIELQGCFVKHLEKMPPTNPLHILMERLDCRLHGFRRLVNRLTRIPEYSSWKRLNQARRAEERTLWQTHIRSKAIHDIKDSKLVAYVLPYARKKHSLSDPATLHHDPTLRKLAIAWRLNLLNGKMCGVCNSPLTRRHAESCITLPPELSLLMATKFDRDKQELRTSYPRLNHLNYTTPDLLLNQHLFSEFKLVMTPLFYQQLTRECQR